MEELWKAIRQGLIDGFDQPYEFTWGMTWEDNQTANEIYDHAVNVGQWFGRMVKA